MRAQKIGVDGNGIVHYDSLAKTTYVWPLCSTPHLGVTRLRNGFVTCLACLAQAAELGGSWWTA